jgi:hypothetical protein
LRKFWARLRSLNTALRCVDPPTDLTAACMKKATVRDRGFQTVQTFASA